MHVTPDSPVTDRAAVMLANAVMYAGAAAPDPDAAPTPVTLHTGDEWTPTPDEWATVCDTVALIVADYESNTLVSMLRRLAARPDAVALAADDLVLLDHWHTAAPLVRAAVVLRLAWAARTEPPVTLESDDPADVFAPARLDTARTLQAAARTHWHDPATGGTLEWFGSDRFPVAWPDHEGAALARRLVDTTDEDGATITSLYVALLLASAAVAAGGVA